MALFPPSILISTLEMIISKLTSYVYLIVELDFSIIIVCP